MASSSFASCTDPPDTAEPPCDAERHELHADAERGHDGYPCLQPNCSKTLFTAMARTTPSAT
ncbi:hypothetical protein F4W67_09615 [Pseudomonas caricapapayae]|nr:hypothetical protein F4W67_09615 [Pseudomonas caricapapayae]